MLTIAVVLFAMQLAVLSTPVAQEAGRINIALTRRDAPQKELVDPQQLQESLISAVFKIANGLKAYKENTGEEHPLAADFIFPSTPGGKVDRRASKSAIPLQDDGGALWQGSLTVGTPPQTYTVQMDTGSSDLFLPGPRCQSSCSGHKVYNPSSSSTAVDRHKGFSLAYGGGDTVEGEQYLDAVSIAGLSASGQTLGAASEYSEGFSADNFPPDGLLGMAYQSISDYNSPPLFQTLVSQKQVAQAVFAFKLSNSGSLLTLGGVDNTKYTGSITYAPVTTKGYWQVTLDAVTVNGNSVVGPLQSIIDTGTTLIIGDAAHVKAFYSKIPGSKDASSTVGPGFYTFPCSSTPQVAFTFAGQSFKIDPKFFNLGRTSLVSNECVGGIVGSPLFPFWIVGDVFLQNVYSVYDLGQNRVGFATLK